MSVESDSAAPETTGVEQRLDGRDGVPPTGRLAVVVNPSKFDHLDALKVDVAKLCQDAGWDEVKWYETSKEDPGEGQARQALADERIKNAVGWPAYLLSGVRAVFDPGFTVRASTHHQQARSHRARMVVVGNCGQLTGGLELLPDARLDDGKLDVVVVAPRGVWGWVAVLGDLLTGRRTDHRDLRRFSSDSIDVVTDRPILAQLDGDAVGTRQRMATRARPGALLVKVPPVEG